MRKFRVKLPTKEYLHSIFRYEDGKLIRISNKKRTDRIGKEAGYFGKNNYRVIQIDKQQYQAHRVIWKMFHGTEPDYLDHIDNDPSNNRIENLQECTNSYNMMKSNLGKGVNFMPSRMKWRARSCMGMYWGS